MVELGVVRGSGCTLQQCVYKTGPGMPEQAAVMVRHAQIFAPVLAMGATGYVMPLLRPLRDAHELGAALNLLPVLWGGTAPTAPDRAAYHSYVLGRPCDNFLLACAQYLYAAVRDAPGTPVGAVHGDATAENAMMLDARPVWIDPNPRTVPLEAELDCGKLLQSALGYHSLPAGGAQVIYDFLQDLPISMQLAHYYLATHLIRLWHYYPERQTWALAIAREVLHGG